MEDRAAVLVLHSVHLHDAHRMIAHESHGNVGRAVLMAATEAMVAVQVVLPRASITGGIVTAVVTAKTRSDT